MKTKEENQTTRLRIAVFVALMGIGLPILLASNCNWSTRAGIETCLIDIQPLRSAADLVWSFAFVNAFTFLIPLALYLLVLIGIYRVATFFMASS